MQVTVHTKKGCPSCTLVKEFLAGIGIPFSVEEHNDLAERNAVYDRFGLVGPKRTMPQVVVAEGEKIERLGGYEATLVSGIGTRYRKALRTGHRGACPRCLVHGSRSDCPNCGGRGVVEVGAPEAMTTEPVTSQTRV